MTQYQVRASYSMTIDMEFEAKNDMEAKAFARNYLEKTLPGQLKGEHKHEHLLVTGIWPEVELWDVNEKD